MNRKTINTILKIIVILFVLVSLGMIIFLFVGGVSGHNKISLLIQSGLIFICSLCLLRVICKSTENKDE